MWGVAPASLDDAYFRLIENFHKNQWVLEYIFGASPLSPYLPEKDEYSLRNSPYGFRNKVALDIDYSCKASYAESVRVLLDNRSSGRRKNY